MLSSDTIRGQTRSGKDLHLSHYLNFLQGFRHSEILIPSFHGYDLLFGEDTRKKKKKRKETLAFSEARRESKRD